MLLPSQGGLGKGAGEEEETGRPSGAGREKRLEMETQGCTGERALQGDDERERERKGG